MRKLNVQELLNELTYELGMEELEEVVLGSQDAVIEFVVNEGYSFKQKKAFYELCDAIRDDKYWSTISLLINAQDERVNPEMAYVLHMATNFGFVSEEIKAEALQLGYMLREKELTDLTSHEPTNISIIIASTKAIRAYETTPFLRIKNLENIIKVLPSVIYNAYGDKYTPNNITRNVLFTILTKAVPDVTPAEIITAFCKSQFPTDLSKEVKAYATRLRAFFYELCNKIGDNALNMILTNTCEAILKFNNRHNTEETFSDKYLNFKLLDGVINKQRDVKSESRMMDELSKTHNLIKRFKITNKKYSDLF